MSWRRRSQAYALEKVLKSRAFGLNEGLVCGLFRRFHLFLRCFLWDELVLCLLRWYSRCRACHRSPLSLAGLSLCHEIAPNCRLFCGKASEKPTKKAERKYCALGRTFTFSRGRCDARCVLSASFLPHMKRAVWGALKALACGSEDTSEEEVAQAPLRTAGRVVSLALRGLRWRLTSTMMARRGVKCVKYEGESPVWGILRR